MKKEKNKKFAVLTLCLIAIAAAGAVYYHFNSKTSEEYAEYYTKEWMKILNKRDEVAFNLKDLDSEAQELVNKYGRFLVKVKEVRPFLDGFKITFSVSNPSGITFPNPKIKLRWNYLRKDYDSQDIIDMPKEYYGDFNKKYEKEIKDWSSSFKEKEFANLKDLTKKSWTDLEFIILPCASERFEHIEFSIVG